ncbi:MAG TPA: hypothetical protein VGD17_19295 [Chitinophagaceae bacterium]
MESYKVADDLNVFGMEVKTFPFGIPEAFDSLKNKLRLNDDRYFFGISKCINGKVVYKAAVTEAFDGEAEQYGCERYVIEKGEYLSESLCDWPQQTHAIKEVLDILTRDDRVDDRYPCIEWYKDNKEMICMVKMKAG